MEEKDGTGTTKEEKGSKEEREGELNETMKRR